MILEFKSDFDAKNKSVLFSNFLTKFVFKVFFIS